MSDNLKCKSTANIASSASAIDVCLVTESLGLDSVSSLMPSASESPSVALSDQERLASLSCEEYEMQLFGFTSKTFADGLYNAFVDFFSDHLDTAMNALKTEVGVGVITDANVLQAKSSIYNSALPVIDGAMDKLESYIRTNVFNVPTYALLNEDRCHYDYPNDVETVKELSRDIAELEKKLLAMKHMKLKLNEELEESEAVMKALDQICEMQKLNENMLLPSHGLVEATRQVATTLSKLSGSGTTELMDANLEISSSMKRTTSQQQQADEEILAKRLK